MRTGPRHRVSIGVLGVLVLAALAGCQQVKKVLPNATWQERLGWRAEDYFDDPQVTALCRAIEADDLAEIDRLIGAGANVNAQGKGKMTPLLWAFPDNKLERFKRLLERGADPNVIVEDDFGTRGVIMKGTSVTHLASGTTFPGFFEAVFDHGGDPNLVQKTFALGAGFTPLFTVITRPISNKRQKIQLLIDKGADLNHLDIGGQTAAMWAVNAKQLDIVLMLLEAGADPKIYYGNGNMKLVYMLLVSAGNMDYASTWTPQLKRDYQAVVQWLEAHGESFTEAQADLDRWKQWSRDTGEYQRKMAVEVAARKARESQAKKEQTQGDENADP